jgi:hypothetical protein
MKNVTKRQAEGVVNALKRQYKEWLPEDGEGGPWVGDYAGYGGVQVIWEDGPSEWTFSANGGGVDEEAYQVLRGEFGISHDKAWAAAQRPGLKTPTGVACEPYNGFVLSLYRAEDY